ESQALRASSLDAAHRLECELILQASQSRSQPSATQNLKRTIKNLIDLAGMRAISFKLQECLTMPRKSEGWEERAEARKPRRPVAGSSAIMDGGKRRIERARAVS